MLSIDSDGLMKESAFGHCKSKHWKCQKCLHHGDAALCRVNKGLFHFVCSRKSTISQFIPLTDLPWKVSDRQRFALKSKPANWIQPCRTCYFYCLLKDVLVFLKEAVYGDSHSGPQSAGLLKSPLSCLPCLRGGRAPPSATRWQRLRPVRLVTPLLLPASHT